MNDQQMPHEMHVKENRKRNTKKEIQNTKKMNIRESKERKFEKE